MTTKPTETPASDPGSPVDFDVVVVGGGAAGLSAAVYTARYGLETLVLARGKSAIRQCAHLENYLGFPGGVSPETFVSLGRAHVEHEGGTVIEDMVTGVDRAEPGFRVEAGDGRDFVATSLLVASAYDGSYLDGISGIETADPEGLLVGEHGWTAVDGLYAAGWIVDETAHQAIINAGHGARVALALIRDDLCERYWEEIADRYVDWVVREGRYGGEGWDEHVAEWFDREMLPEDGDGEIDPAIAEGALEDLKAEFLGREITEDERRRREKRGYDLITAHLETTNP
jgi:NADPH-dependent 2,4-dienoyl-CoA reductase/sulfur reductase-like enzyme